MIEQTTMIINKLGLHARAAAKLVATASAYSSQVEIGLNTANYVNAKSIMSVMLLAASKGTEVCLRIDGDDEAAAMEGVLSIIANRFDEDE